MSLHDDAVGLLRSWPAPGEGQERLRAGYVAHLEQHPDGAYRDCFPDHLTAGTLVLSEDGSRVLLNLHGKARRWFAFGGHCEPGDATLADAARREAVEESGIDGLRLDPVPVHLDAHQVTFCDPRGTVRHLDVRFAAVAPADAAPAVSAESLDVCWFPVDRLPQVGPEMLALVDLARRRLGRKRSPSTGS